MQDTPTYSFEPTTRPVPRWVRFVAIATVVTTVGLLGLGGFVTSFRVGMADPVWPTEPWFLLDKDWQQLEFGFLIEHTHRLAGWIVGAAATVLAVAAWWYEPRTVLRRVGLIAIVGLLLAYGEFHRGMGKVWKEIQTETQTVRPGPITEVAAADLTRTTHVWPVPQGILTGLLAIGVLGVSIFAAFTRSAGGWVRTAAGFGLVFVMAQGLLGGFRVFLNALMGTNLAAVHGVFGQLTFAVFVAAMVLAKPRSMTEMIPNRIAAPLSRLALGLVALLVMQLVWAVMVRHGGSTLAQRLHILTAFAVTGVAVWLAVWIMIEPATRRNYRGASWHLLGILLVQLTLGVEAYLGKFVTAGPQAFVLPELRTISEWQATTRTAHQLIGAGLLATAVALAVRLRQPSVGPRRAEESDRESRAVLPERTRDFAATS